MKTIINIINIIKSDANDAAKLAREIARIPAVDIDSIKVWTAPTNGRTGVNSYVEFMGIHAKFAWHDHAIEIDENFSGELIVKYDSKVIGEVFWSALWGKLESNSNYTLTTKAQHYIMDSLWKAVYHISAKGKPYEKVALPKSVKYGDCTIYAEGATIYAVNNGETIRVMGNTWRGLCWTSTDVRVLEIQKVIKKAFIEY